MKSSVKIIFNCWIISELQLLNDYLENYSGLITCCKSPGLGIEADESYLIN